jgi:uncharacterized protein YqiB (DUF1249 family)
MKSNPHRDFIPPPNALIKIESLPVGVWCMDSAAMDIYQGNYIKLLKLVPTLHEDKITTSFTIPQCPDLSVEVIYRHGTRVIISLGEYFTLPYGDVITDIDLTISVHVDAQMVEVLAYHDAFGHRHAYSHESTSMSNHDHSLDLNEILRKWLIKLLNQGPQAKARK